MTKAFYSIEEFANELGVHHNTVRRAIKDRRIHAIRLGKGRNACYRIPSSEIMRIGAVQLEDIIELEIQKRKEGSQ